MTELDLRFVSYKTTITMENNAMHTIMYDGKRSTISYSYIVINRYPNWRGTVLSGHSRLYHRTGSNCSDHHTSCTQCLTSWRRQGHPLKMAAHGACQASVEASVEPPAATVISCAVA